MPAKPPDVTLTPAREPDLPALLGMLERTGVFRPAEVEVAREVLDIYFHKPGQRDYQVYTASRAGAPVGWVCFGLNALTEGTFELYWICVDPRAQRHGVGRSLMALAEYEAARQGGRIVVVETSSREDYHGTRRFYLALGYRQAALVPDYYAPGDGKVVLVKRLARPS